MYLRQIHLGMTEIRDIAWKARVRLCARYRRMSFGVQNWTPIGGQIWAPIDR